MVRKTHSTLHSLEKGATYMSYSFDRQFQQRLELIFRKAEFDRMAENRRQRELEQKQQNTADPKPKNDNGTKCDKQAPAPKPR
jgi:hypothetical protein